MTPLVGVDVGPSATKGRCDRPARPRGPEGGVSLPHAAAAPRFSEQDPEDWGQAANQALSDIFTPRTAGLAFTEQMHGLVLLDGPGPIDELLPEVDGIVVLGAYYFGGSPKSIATSTSGAPSRICGSLWVVRSRSRRRRPHPTERERAANPLLHHRRHRSLLRRQPGAVPCSSHDRASQRDPPVRAGPSQKAVEPHSRKTLASVRASRQPTAT